MATKNFDAPVLIAGGGLVGLSAAMFLAQYGVRSLAIERLRNVLPLPRAAFFHMRTIELFRSCGIEAEVRAQSEKEFEPEGAVVAVDFLAGKQIAAFIPSLNEGVDALSPLPPAIRDAAGPRTDPPPSSRKGRCASSGRP